MTPSQMQEIRDMLTALTEKPNYTCEKEAVFADLSDKIAGIAQTQAVIVEQLRVITATNQKVTETVYGNGKPGLTTVVAETKKDMDAVMTVAKTLLFTLMGLGVTAVFYLVLSHGIIK